MKRSLRILFVAYYHGLGHVVRSAVAAQELQRRGHTVLFACSARAAHVPESYGLTCEEIFELDPVQAVEATNSAPSAAPSAAGSAAAVAMPLGGLAPPDQAPVEPATAKKRSRVAEVSYVKRCLSDEAGLIKRFRPDVVVSDFRNTTGVSCAIAGVPSVSLYNARFFEHPMADILPDVLDTLSELHIPEQARAKFFGDVIVIPDFSLFDPMAVIPKPIMDMIVASAREIRYVGPLVKSVVKPATKRDLFSVDRPLLLITFGGTAMSYAHLQAALLALSGGIEANLVIITGPNILPETISPLVDGIVKHGNAEAKVFGFTERAFEFMQMADVAIIHGGHGTMMEAIVSGTPLIVVPAQKEQSDNARRVVDLGVGRIIAPDEIQGLLRPTVVDMLQDQTMRGRCSNVAATFGHTSGARAFADFMEGTWWRS